MTYIMSDLHGGFKQFKKMIQEIKFNPSVDKLIIAGDIMDRGTGDLQILEYIEPFLKEGTVELILGNHEFFLMQYLANFLQDKEIDRITGRLWGAFGAEQSTIDAIDKMSIETKDRLYTFLDGLPYYIEMETEDKQIVITHAGLNADYIIYNADNKIDVTKSIDYAMDKDKRGTLISTDIHHMPASQKKALDKLLIVGHEPTVRIGGDNKIIKYDTYICIDCGNGKGFDGKLGCICLDNGREYYV